MNYKDIKGFRERCEGHPDHQTGTISYSMIHKRLQEEIVELRNCIEQRPWVGLTNQDIHKAVIETGIHVFEGDIYAFVQMLQDVLQEKNNG
tara:strand:- start:227 stop:499 length:273 start_codon:yes stop_codon:yes gene_type:complete